MVPGTDRASSDAGTARAQRLGDGTPADRAAGMVTAEDLVAAGAAAARRARCGGGLAACRLLWRRQVGSVLHRWRHGSRDLCPQEAAALLIALTDLPTRDAAACWGVRRSAARGAERKSGGPGRPGDGADRELWAELCRRAPPPFNVAPATLLALSAWRADDVPAARQALQAALAGDPTYRLARLLQRALAAGVKPAPVRRQGRQPTSRVR